LKKPISEDHCFATRRFNIQTNSSVPVSVSVSVAGSDSDSVSVSISISISDPVPDSGPLQTDFKKQSETKQLLSERRRSSLLGENTPEDTVPELLKDNKCCYSGEVGCF
jgi:hypothetical protein